MKQALVLFLVSSFYLAGQALGQPKPIDAKAREKAKEIFLEAEAEYKGGRFGNALEGYYESFMLSNEPLLLYNMGQCYRNLGRYQEAVDTYKQFVERAPETPFTPKAQKWINELSAKLPPPPPAPKPESAPTSNPASSPTSTSAQSQPASSPALVAPDTKALQSDQLSLDISEEERGLKKARVLYRTGGILIAGGLVLGGATLLEIQGTRNLQERPDAPVDEIQKSIRRSLITGIAADLSFVAGGFYIQRGFSLASKEKTAKIEFAAAPTLNGVELSVLW